MRERTGPVSWLEAAVLTFPEPGYRRGLQWFDAEVLSSA
jgi:hypothetical protein